MTYFKTQIIASIKSVHLVVTYIKNMHFISYFYWVILLKIYKSRLTASSVRSTWDVHKAIMVMLMMYIWRVQYHDYHKKSLNSHKLLEGRVRSREYRASCFHALQKSG